MKIVVKVKFTRYVYHYKYFCVLTKICFSNNFFRDLLVQRLGMHSIERMLVCYLLTQYQLNKVLNLKNTICIIKNYKTFAFLVKNVTKNVFCWFLNQSRPAL